jgi:hypothetical protein
LFLIILLLISMHCANVSIVQPATLSVDWVSLELAPQLAGINTKCYATGRPWRLHGARSLAKKSGLSVHKLYKACQAEEAFAQHAGYQHGTERRLITTHSDQTNQTFNDDDDDTQ